MHCLSRRTNRVRARRLWAETMVSRSLLAANACIDADEKFDLQVMTTDIAAMSGRLVELGS